jgi:hypothetical protein
MEILNFKLTMKTTFQIYKHYKLPITVDPSEYGKIIYKDKNLFIVHFNKTNIAIITKNDDYNGIKFYRLGELVLEYRDHIINNNTFIRIIDNQKYTFKNKELISFSTENAPIYSDTDAII